MRAAVLAWFALFAVSAGVRPAAAIPFETFLDVSDQAELEDLLAAGDISQDTYDAVLDLLERGVDLNDAGREELYALPNLTYDDVDSIIAFRTLNRGVIANPADLVGAGALSEEKFLAIAAYLIVSPEKDKLAIHGWIRAQTRVSSKDYQAGLPAPVALRSRMTVQRHLQAGIALTTTRLRIGDPIYDPNRDALIAEDPHLRLTVPKVFLKYEDDTYAAIAGSFRAGFAQRLVFDNSSQYTPNGLYHDDQLFFAADLARECRQSAGELETSPCAGEAGDTYVTPDFTWRNGLFGAGAGVKRLELPSGWLQGFAWASASKRSIYQYELVDREACSNPHDDADPACSAPVVYVKPEGALLDPTSRFSFITVPNVFIEKLAGANLSYYADRRNSVGATIYGAQVSDLVEGMELDFQEWSRYPNGRMFGAGGANFAFGRGWLDVFGELAYSYDKTPGNPPSTGGGGPAGILRVTATRQREELEAVFRYYSIDYANPYARPISQPDEFDGQRARDELGLRLRYLKTSKQLSVRALIDVWVPPSTLRDDSPAGHAQPRLDTYVRADVRTTDELRLGLWARYQDKDLYEGGNNQCYEVSTETSEAGDPVPCSGRQLTSIVRARYQPQRALTMTLMVQHQLLDDRALSPTAFRQDLALWGIATWAPNRDFRMRARARLLDEAIQDNEYLERSLSALVDAGFRMRTRDLLRVRVDTKFWLDKRAATLDRDPNPELQLWLSYEARL